MNLQHFAGGAETNVITTEQMKKAREVDFVEKFAHDGLKNLLKALGVTRMISKNEGDELYVYKTTGTLEDGTVAEGDGNNRQNNNSDDVLVRMIKLFSSV